MKGLSSKRLPPSNSSETHYKTQFDGHSASTKLTVSENVTMAILPIGGEKNFAPALLSL